MAVSSFRHCKDRGLPFMSLLAFLSIIIGKTLICYFDFFTPFFDIFSSCEFGDIKQNIIGIRRIQSTIRWDWRLNGGLFFQKIEFSICLAPFSGRLPVLRRCYIILFRKTFTECCRIVEADHLSHFLYGILLGKEQLRRFLQTDVARQFQDT